MASRMNLICRKTNLNLEEASLCENVQQNCFILTLTASKCDGYELNGITKKQAKLELKKKPCSEEQSDYELIVDYKLIVDTQTELVERDFWQNKEETLITIELDSCSIKVIELWINIRETLAPQDLSVATSFRNFNILSAGKNWFVNTNQLNALGGRMFKEWYERDCQGEQTAVVQSLNNDELEVLLKACCAYTTPIVHSRNFDSLIEIADKERITGLLRILESFLIESQSLNPIRKLEFAAEYRMARLATTILKSFPNRVARLDTLFAYLAENGENITDVHLDVLTMLEIHPEYIIL